MTDLQKDAYRKLLERIKRTTKKEEEAIKAADDYQYSHVHDSMTQEEKDTFASLHEKRRKVQKKLSHLEDIKKKYDEDHSVDILNELSKL